MENRKGANGYASSIETGLMTHDSLSEVKQCLNCNRPECSNCLIYKTKPLGSVGPQRKKVQELYFAKSMEADEIAILLGVTRKTVMKHIQAIKRGGMARSGKV